MNDRTRAANAAFPPYPGVADLPGLEEGRKFALAALRQNVHGATAVLRYQIEALAFLQRRAEQNVKLIEDLVAHDEFRDAFDVFANFFENAASEYASEAGKVAAIGSKLASETASRVQKEADEAIGDIAARTVVA